jgi:hypothetical protein
MLGLVGLVQHATVHPLFHTGTVASDSIRLVMLY